MSPECDLMIGHCACGAFHTPDNPGTRRRKGFNPPDTGGTKYDSDKPKWSLLPWDAVAEVVSVFTIGARKYEERNWEKGMQWSRVYNSLERHATDWFQNRAERDAETNLRQIAQVAWAALVLTAYELRGIGTDDRPVKARPHTSEESAAPFCPRCRDTGWLYPDPIKGAVKCACVGGAPNHRGRATCECGHLFSDHFISTIHANIPRFACKVCKCSYLEES